MTGRSGVVLAGGYSRRFGSEDKALAELDGYSLIGRVINAVSTVTDEVVVSCRPTQVGRFKEIRASTPVDGVVEDRFQGAGPLAGIEAGLNATMGTYAAVVACDMPLVEPAVIEALFERADGVDAVVPEHTDGQLQPVQAVYRSQPMYETAKRMLPERGSMHAALDTLDVITVPTEQFPERSFHNVNTRQDLELAEQRRPLDR